MRRPEHIDPRRGAELRRGRVSTLVVAVVLALLGRVPARGQGGAVPQGAVLPPCRTPGQIVEMDVSSGLNVSPGQQDPRWKLTAVPPNQTGTFPSYATIPYSSWVPATPPAAWIHRIQNPTPQADSAGNYDYRFSFNLNLALYSSIQIVGNYSVDNSVSVGLNGVTQTFCPGIVCFQALHPVNIASGFVNGINDLDFIVNNSSGPSPTGLLVEAKIQATCGCVLPPSDMVSWWPFDESGGTVVHDIEDGNDGISMVGGLGSGGPTPVPGIVGGALNFNGTSDFVQVSDAPNLNFGSGSLSLDAWVNVPAPGTGLMPIVDKEVSGPTDVPYGYAFYVSGGHLGFSMNNDVNSAPHASIGADDLSTNLADNLWHHVAVTVQRNPASATGGSLLIDGVPVATFDTTPFINLTADNTGDLIVGSRNRLGRLPVSDFFNGSIDEVEIFDRALGSQEIFDIFHAGAAGKCKPVCVSPPPGMVAWYPLDELAGATVVNDIAPPPDSLIDNAGTPLPSPVGTSGGPAPVLGRVGGGLYFYGPYVDVPPQAELDFGAGDFSIDGWIRAVRCLPGVLAPIVDKLDTGANAGFSFYVGQSPPGVGFLNLQMNGSAFTSAGSLPAISNPLLNSGSPWVHVAVTVSRSSGPAAGVFYVNGSPAGTFSPPAGSVTNSLSMQIGRMRLPGGTCEIAIDELELFNRALASSEIQDLYNAGPAGKCRSRTGTRIRPTPAPIVAPLARNR